MTNNSNSQASNLHKDNGGRTPVVVLDVRVLQKPVSGVGNVAFDIYQELVALSENGVIRLLTVGLSGRRYSEYYQIHPEYSFPKKEKFCNILSFSPIFLNFILPRFLKQHNADYLLTPTYFGPIRQIHTRRIAVVHDLAHRRVREAKPWWYRLYLNVHLWLSVRNQHKVLTISHASKRDLIRYYGPEMESKVGVRYPRSPLMKMAEKATLPMHDREPIVLFLVGFEKRKHLDASCRVVPATRRRVPDVRFVVGSGDPYERFTMFPSCIDCDCVELVRHADDSALYELYSRAKVLIYPSLYEGLGFAVLEALAAGLPVVGTNRPAVDELLSPTFPVFNPYDIDMMVEETVRLLTDPSYWQAQSLASRHRYTELISANATLESVLFDH